VRVRIQQPDRELRLRGFTLFIEDKGQLCPGYLQTCPRRVHRRGFR